MLERKARIGVGNGMVSDQASYLYNRLVSVVKFT